MRQLGVEQVGGDALADELREVLGVVLLRISACATSWPNTSLRMRVHQQARGDLAVGRVFFHQRARGQDGGLVQLFDRHAVVQVLDGLARIASASTCFSRPTQAALISVAHSLAGRADGAGRSRSRAAAARSALPCAGFLLRALLHALVAVQHVGARDIVFAGAHQREFDLVLHVFDMEGAAGRLAAHQGARPRSRSAARPVRARARKRRPGRHSQRGRPWSWRSRSSTARSRPRRRYGG